MFDPAKESTHVLSRKNPYGNSFDLLGVRFDCKLVMSETVHSLAGQCKWKLRAILRTQKFNTGMELVTLYKAQLLSFIEYRTPAIYHACASALLELDRIQDRLMNAAGFNEAEVLRVCRLAPLTARRDMAMLGLIHRTVLGKGPCHFRAFFKPDIHKRQAGSGRHRLQLCDYGVHESDLQFPGSRPADYLQNSALGLVQVYNLLPAGIVENSSSVSSFQSALQGVLMARATAGCTDWKFTFSPRVPMHRHPLRIL